MIFLCFFFLFNCLPYLVNKDEFNTVVDQRSANDVKCWDF